jgi:hypothetical protein
MATDWLTATPEQRGQIRETIHRSLREYRKTETGLHYALEIPLETVREALAAMLASGAITREMSKGKWYYSAAVKP